MQPINYMTNQINPLQQVSQSLNIMGQAAQIRNIKEQRELAELKKRQDIANALEYKHDYRSTIENPTPQSIASLSLKYPEKEKAIKFAFEQLSDEQKQNEIKQGGAVYSAFMSGNTEVANNIIDRQIEASRNAGRDTKNLEMIKAVAEENPKMAATFVGSTLSTAMGSDNFKAVFKDLDTKRKYNVLSPKEKKTLGLDVNAPYQIDNEGKISQIGGGGVTVNLGRDGERVKPGPIPAGWEYIQNPDGTTELKPVRGGPAEQKAKAIAVKKVKQSALEDRAGNVVLQDIGRLKAKIQDSSFFSPTTGVGGYIASFVPSTRRVDAENLKETIVANIGFDRLQQMRDASPTGGALGAISERELSTLQSVLGNLSMSQSEKQLVSNIDRLDNIYKGILEKAESYPNANEFGFGQAPVTQSYMKYLKR